MCSQPFDACALREEIRVTAPRIFRVRPLTGVEGGRVTIFGEGLCGDEVGQPSPRLNGTETRPLIASPAKIVAA